MNMNRIIGIVVSCLLVAGCCVFDNSSGPPPLWTMSETVDLVGFVPETPALKAELEDVLKKYSGPGYESDAAIFRVRKYEGGNDVQGWGALPEEQIACELRGAVKFWLEHGPFPGGG